MKTRLFSGLLALCLCLALLPTAALALEFSLPQTVGADFSTDPAAALSALTGSQPGCAQWDGNSQTLTLLGVHYEAGARIAVRLPAGASLVLADGSQNTVALSASVSVDGKKDQIVCGIWADGPLTVSGGGSLLVTSGAITHTGSGSPYSVGLYCQGDLTVQSGSLTCTGGKALSMTDSMAFSNGVKLATDASLTVTGGSLTCVGGESMEQEEDTLSASFSRGLYLYRGNIAVSGSGRLSGLCDSVMDDEGLAWGIYVLMGNLTVSGSAQVSAKGTTAVEICGDVLVSGGSLTAQTTGTWRGYSLAICRDYSLNVNANLTVTGGRLDLDGNVYLYQYQPTDAQGVFTLSGGSVTCGRLYGANRLLISGGSLTVNGAIDGTGEVAVSGGSLTVREPVRVYNGNVFASPAIRCSRALTVSGGTLDAAWDWSPAPDSQLKEPASLIQTGSSGAAGFLGGTALLDTGRTGGLALTAGSLTVSDAVRRTGSDDALSQLDALTPVVFSDVTPTVLTLAGIHAQNKVYDGSAAATLSADPLTGVAAGHSARLDSASVAAEFPDPNVGTGKPVAVTGGQFRLQGRDAYRYTLTQPADLSGLTASITPCTQVTDTTLLSQRLTAGSGSIQAPSFTGVGGEAASGSLSYTCQINQDPAAAVSDADALAQLLSRCAPGDTALISYVFSGSGNYAGAAASGQITVSIVSRPASSSAVSYPIQVEPAQNGTVSVRPLRGVKGETITVTVQPQTGYRLASLTASSGGASLPLTGQDGVFTFRMPAAEVHVIAVFEPIPASAFLDVAPDDYFADAVTWALDSGVAQGVSQDRFAPNLPCTRAQMLTFLWRSAGSPNSAASASFFDVPTGAYWAQAAAWGKETGVAAGTGQDCFSPDAPCTRAQAAAFVYRLAAVQGLKLSAGQDLAASFPDGAQTPAYAREAINWALNAGILQGDGSQLLPNAPCTRAQILTMLYRLHSLLP